MTEKAHLLALFSVVALGVTAATAKHVGVRQTIEAPPTTNKANISELSTEKGNSSEPGHAEDFELALRTPLAVYTLPLSARVTLTPLGLRSLGQVYNACLSDQEKAMEVFTSQAVYQPLDYIKYSDVPEMLLKYFLGKATWRDAQKICADDGAALYTFDHSVQLDSAMANFYPLLLPWVDLQKARVDGGSMLCGYLHGPEPSKSSLRWDDCNTQREFICQKPASSNIYKPLLGSSPLVTLFDFLKAFGAQGQAVANFLNPRINEAALQSTQVTPAQLLAISAMVNKIQNFNFVVIPRIISMLANTSELSTAQNQQIKQAAEQGVFLYSQLQIISINYSTQFNFSAAQRQAIVDFGAEADGFYGIIANIVSKKQVQPTVSKEQATQLQDIIAHTQILIEEAAIAFSLKTTPTKILTKNLGRAIATPTTETRTTVALPYASLAQILQAHVTLNQEFFDMMEPLLLVAMSQTSLLSAEQMLELQNLDTQIPIVLSSEIPGQITLLSNSSSLSPAQIALLQVTLAQSVALLDTARDVVNNIAPLFDMNADFLQAVNDFIAKDKSLFLELQSIFSNSNLQPTITPEQIAQLQNIQIQGQFLLNTADGLFYGTTTTSPTTAAPLSSLAQVFIDFLASNQEFFRLTNTVLLASSTQTNLLTPAQVKKIQDAASQGQNLLTVKMPNVVTMLSTTPTLNPAQIFEVKSAYLQAADVVETFNDIINTIGPILGISPAIQHVGRSINSQSQSFVGTMLAIFADPIAQPSISPTQQVQLQSALTQFRSLINAANTLLPTLTTTTSTPTAAPLSSLAQVFTDFLASNQYYFNLIQPFLLASSTQTNLLTPAQVQQIQNIASQGQNLMTVSMPNVYALLSTTPILNPAQISLVKSAYSQAAALLTASNDILNTIAPILGISPAIQQVAININSQSQAFVSTMLAIFADPIAQPSISPSQQVQLQTALSQFRSLINAANTLLPTITTTTSTPTAAPLLSFAQVFADFLASNQDYFNLTQTVLQASSAQTNLLTPAQVQQIQNIASQGQNLLTVVMPNVYTLVLTTPILSPADILQVTSAYTQAAALLTSSNDILNTIAPILGISPAIQQVAISLNSQSQAFVSTTLAIFADPQPSISPTQSVQLQDALSQFRSLINAANTLLSTITTTTSTPTGAPLSSFAQVFADFLASNQDYFNLTQTVLQASSTQTNLLTPSQVQQIQNIASQGQNLLTVAMPNVYTLLDTTPFLSPADILQVKSAYTQAAALLTASYDILNTIAPILGLSPAIQQVATSINSQSQAFVGTMLAIFADPIAQPSISPTQQVQLQSALSQFRSLINAANTLLSTITTTTTTTAPTTTASPLPTLTQLIAAIETLISGGFNPYVQMLSSANLQALTPIEQAQIEAAILLSQNLQSQTASILSILSTNPTLTPALVQQLKDHFSHRLTLMTALKCLVNELGEKAGLSAWLQQTIVNMAGLSIKGNAAILGLLSNPNSQTISAAQYSLIQGLLAEIQAAINAVTNSFTTTTVTTTKSSTTTTATTATTTTVTTPSTTRPSTTRPSTTRRPSTTHPSTTRRPSTTHGTTHSRPRPTTRPSSHGNNQHHHHHHEHHHELSSIERHLLLSRIQGLMAELQLLFGTLHSPYVALRTDASQRSQPEVLINKLLSLSTREAEIKARAHMMSAQEQEAIASKLEDAQQHLLKLNSDQSLLARYLTTTSGDQQLITVFLNKTVNVLEPFF